MDKKGDNTEKIFQLKERGSTIKAEFIAYLLGLTVDGFYETLNLNIISPVEAFRAFGEESLFAVFTKGLDFSAYDAKHGSANPVLTIATTALAFCSCLSLCRC